MRFSWIKARGVVAVSAAAIALQGVPALAQFVPFTPSPTKAASKYQAHTAQQTAPAQRAQTQYTAMAYQQGSGTRVASPTLNVPVESLAPGQAVPSAPMQSYSGAPAAGCNCQASPAPTVSYSQPAPPAASYESYPSSSSYTPNSCAPYNTFGASSGIGVSSTGSSFLGGGLGGGLGAGLGSRRGGTQWFGGIYGLYMQRDGNPWKSLAFSTPEANPDGYYPTDNEFVLNLTDLDNDSFAGAEFRLGTTLGKCGNLAWEAVYWGLAEDEQTQIVTDTAGDGNRLYTMLNQAGIRYDADGAGAGVARSANDYFEYAPPVNFAPAGDEIRVRQITARNKFSMQNMELNFLRMSLLGGGYYAAPAGALGGGRGGPGLGGGLLGRRGGAGGCATGACASGGCATGGCATGGCGSYSGSCGDGGGCGCGASRYSLTGLVGVRYMRIDEDFLFRSDFDNVTQATTGFLSHNVDVDNHLVGAQFGMNGIYRLGNTGRWALNLNTVVGVYGNHMEVWNRMDVPTGGSAETADGANYNFRYEDDDIALIGELRAGASYQYSCNWRLFGGYRAVGVSGVALAFDQISQQSATAAQVQYVDSDGSVFMHGLQSGIEFTY